MKKVITLFLCMLMIICGNNGLWQSISRLEFNKETPVATNAPVGNYAPVSDDVRNNYDVQMETLKKEVNDMGGYIETYASEEEYIAKQKAAKSTNNDVIAYNVTFKPVKQTFVILDKLTSKPINNAIVRLDGVPYFTGRNGTVTITLTKESYELYIEKIDTDPETEDYNPYIEFIDITTEKAEDTKTVYLKKASDDIAIFSATLDQEGINFNLLTQPCEIYIDFGYYISEIIVGCNVEADEYLLFKNGECLYSRDNNIFEDVDFSYYGLGGGFSVQVIYQGIESKIYDLQLTISEIPSEIPDGGNPSGPNTIEIDNEGTTTDEDTHVDFISNVNLDFSWLLNILLTEALAKPDKGFLSKFDSGIEYDIRKGTIEITVGWTWEPVKITEDSFKKCDDELNEYRERQKKDKAKLAEKQQELNKLKAEKAANSTTSLDNKIKEQQIEINKLAKKKKSGDEYARAKQSQSDREKNIQKMKAVKAGKDAIVEPILKAIEDGKASIDNLKDAIKQAGGKLKDGNPFSLFENKIKKFGVDLSLFGKIKLQIWDADKGLPTFNFVDFSLSFSVKVQFSYTQQFLVWVIPMYLKFTATAGLEIKLTYDGTPVNNLKDFANLIDLLVTIGIRLDAGIGVSDFISIGAYGGYTFKADKYGLASNWGDEEGWYIRSEFSYGIKAQLLFLEHEFGKNFTIDHFGKDKNDKAKLMSRSFSSQNVSLSENQIFYSSYQNSKPQLLQIKENKYLLTWIEDSRNRDTYNRTVLKYAIYDSGIWSESKAIYDDAKSDFYHDSYFDGKNAYVVWQKASKIYTGEDTLETMAKVSEIYFAEFNLDKNQFNIPERITKNSEMDIVPKFVKKEKLSDPLTILWRKNTDDNMLGNTGKNGIYAIERENNCTWGDEQKIYETDNYISFVDGAYKNNELALAFTYDVDNDITTEDRLIKVIYKKTVNILEENDSSNIQFAMVNNEMNLFYFSHGKILFSRDLINRSILLDENSLATADNFSIISNENGSVVFYEKVVNETRQALCAVYEEDSQNWICDILLTNETSRVYNTAGFLNSKGNISIVYNIQNENEESNLCFLEKRRNYDIQIDSAYATEFIENDQESAFFINITNTGDYNISKLEVLAFKQSYYIFLEKPLRINESRCFKVLFSAKINTESQEKFIVKIYFNDIIVCESDYFVNVIFTDIEIDGNSNIINSKQKFALNIKNNTSIKTEAVLIVKVNGILVSEFEISIDAYALIEKQIIFDEININDSVSFEIKTDINDFYYGNNKLIIKSMMDEYEIFDSTNNIYSKLLNQAKSLT